MINSFVKKKLLMDKVEVGGTTNFYLILYINGELFPSSRLGAAGPPCFLPSVELHGCAVVQGVDRTLGTFFGKKNSYDS